MNLTLRRFKADKTGIYSNLSDDNKYYQYYTLEHAYIQPDGSYKPKLNDGDHVCSFGAHEVGHLGSIKTYEILSVPGHSGILFHVGNYNDDSEGCVLLGLNRTATSVVQSKEAFARFINDQNSCNFVLTVVS